MCWKQEWASAINNIQHAIEHIEKAQNKLMKRKERNKGALKYKWVDRHDFYEKEKIEARITKNNAGIEQCKGVITELKERQDELFKMIHQYGISKSDDPMRVYKLMGKYPYAEKLKEYKIEERETKKELNW